MFAGATFGEGEFGSAGEAAGAIALVVAAMTGGSTIDSGTITFTPPAPGVTHLAGSGMVGGSTIDAGTVTTAPPVPGVTLLAGSGMVGGSTISTGVATVPQVSTPSVAYLTKENLIGILQRLLPEGPAWPRTRNSTLSKLLASFASLFSLLDLRLWDLRAELNPATSSELLPDWEAFVGAADECCTTLGTVPERRARVVTKLNEQGGLSRAYFLRLAADLGYTDTTITELRPSSCEMDCESPVMEDERWRFVWNVNLPHQGDSHSFFRADARCDSLVDSYAFGALECQFMRLKPAHTYVIFTYEGLA